ncbi:hypothetical protein ACN42_g5177 [Penicillium freii]|uniref:Uncharacterized protein n=1 Tax=Penicillium freii TaxID=48697 RepID=A0A117NP86_PENFR|nr:hypothetical protein ACN42_g5177 [Penicillium freii]
MSKGKRHRRHGRAKPAQQTQSPACSSSLSSPVKEKGRRRDEQHKANKRHKNKKRLPSSSSQVKAQEAGSSRERSLSSLQRAPPRKVEIVYESDFEFEYKDETQAKVQLQALLALRSPPSSPQRGVSLKRTTPVSGCEYENQIREEVSSSSSSSSDEDSESKRRRDQTTPSQPPSSSLQMLVSLKRPTPVSHHRFGNETNEVSSSDEDSECERGREPVSPSRSIPSSRQKVVNLTNATPVPSHDRRHTPRVASLSSSLSESQSVFTSESEGESALPSPASPALPERVVGHNTTSVSRPDYGQQSRESSTSDTDDESETASEAEPSSEPGLSLSSPSPWELSRMTTLKRNRSNAHHSSHRKVVPFPLPSLQDALPGVESEPMLPSERAWSILPSLDRFANSEPMMQNFRSEHRRKACEKKRRSFPTSSRLNSEIGLETPSKSVAETEWQPAESGTESRYPSPSQTTITPASSPPVPPATSRVRSRVLHPSPPPQHWLPRLERPEQESSLIPPLRYRSDIKPPKVPLMIDGKRFPRVFAEIPPGGHENIEFIFPDNPDDDPDFYDPDSDDLDSELPEAKRRRVELSANSPHPEEQAQREGSPSEAQEASNPQQSLVPESEPEKFLDLESSLDLAAWSNPEPLPNLERPSDPEPVPGLEISSDPERISDPETESPYAPIRNELPVWQIRQLNKKIDKAVGMDKEQNPQHWGSSWMKEYERGRQIKEQIEAAYEQEMVRKKEDMERDKQKRHERNKRLKEGREKAKNAMEERKRREDIEAQKTIQEEQKRQQKVSQDREELERRRARARAEKTLREMLDEEKRIAGPQTRSEFRGNQSIARQEVLQIAMDLVKLLAGKKEKEKGRERGDREF